MPTRTKYYTLENFNFIMILFYSGDILSWSTRKEKFQFHYDLILLDIHIKIQYSDTAFQFHYDLILLLKGHTNDQYLIDISISL